MDKIERIPALDKKKRKERESERRPLHKREKEKGRGEEWNERNILCMHRSNPKQANVRLCSVSFSRIESRVIYLPVNSTFEMCSLSGLKYSQLILDVDFIT